MIMPGEVAPAHRHVSSAVRFVLDGEGAYTAVEGEKAFMSRGDFLITANWAPHDHGNTSATPMLWLDVLDAPTVNFFETSFGEDFDSPTQETTRRDGDSLSFYGSGVLPDGTAAQHPMNRTPIINYTYARTRPIVARMLQAGDIDKSHGARVRYANPMTGGPVLPTMSAHLAMLPEGFHGEPYRSTDGTIFACAEGKGTTEIDGEVITGGRTTSSSCRHGSATPTARRSTRCCSRSPTARRRKRSASGAKGISGSHSGAPRSGEPGIHNPSLAGMLSAFSILSACRDYGFPGRAVAAPRNDLLTSRSTAAPAPAGRRRSSCRCPRWWRAASILPAASRSIAVMPRFTEPSALVHS